MAGKTIGQLKEDLRTNVEKQDEFLLWFGQYASVSRAARKARVSRSNVYLWFKIDVIFKEKYDAACAEALGALEDEAVRRAHEGTLKPVFQGGEKVGSVREYSDTLMIVLLKARAPEKYKDRFEHTGSKGKDLFSGKTDEELVAVLKDLSQKLNGE